MAAGKVQSVGMVLSGVADQELVALARSTALLLRRAAKIGQPTEQLDWLEEKAWKFVDSLKTLSVSSASLGPVHCRSCNGSGVDTALLGEEVGDVLTRWKQGGASDPELRAQASIVERAADRLAS